MSKHLSTYIQNDEIQSRLDAVLGDRKQDFITSMSSLVSSNSRLQKCDPATIFSACLTAASIGLPVNSNLGYSYIIPYGDQAQFQMGYKGFMQLAHRSEMYVKMHTTEVKKGEYKGEDLLTGEIHIEQIEDRKERKKADVEGYLAYFKLRNGFEKYLYMDKSEVEAHARKYSQGYRSSRTTPWDTNYDEMAKKTVFKLLLSRWGYTNTSIRKAIEADQAVVTEDGYEYVDNKKQMPSDIASDKERQRILDFIESSTTPKQLQKAAEAVQHQDQNVVEKFEAKMNKLQKEKK